MSWAIAAATGLQVVNGIGNAQAISVNAQIQRQVAEVNANYAELDAYNSIQNGNTKAARYQTTIDQTVGAEKTGMAAGGVDINFGTGAEVQAESKLNGFLNQMDIKTQAGQKALGYDVQANNIRLNSETQQITAGMQETNALIGGATGAASTYASGYGRPNISTQPNPFAGGGGNYDQVV